MLYLVRHAQAGTWHQYDTLSKHGRKQAEKLGHFFKISKIDFDVYITGTLKRHKETLDAIKAYVGQKKHYELESLNEISEELFLKLLNYYKDKDERLHYIYKKAFKASEKKYFYPLLLKKIFEIWLRDNSFEYGFSDFKNKIYTFFLEIQKLLQFQPKQILVISSGIPIAILHGFVLNWEDKKSIEFLKKIYNTSFSIFEITQLVPIQGKVHALLQIPHLSKEEITLI